MALVQVNKALSTRAKLLKAATTLFATKGFQGTSTRDIAKRARVNETTLFRLFKNKQDLYVTVLESQMGRTSESVLPMLKLSRDDESTFMSLADHLQGLFDPVFTRLLFFAALEKPELLRKKFRSDISRLYEILGAHIKQRIEDGRLRELDPGLMGRAFVAMIAYHEIFSELLGGRDFPGSSDPDCTRTYTDLWLRGALVSRIHEDADAVSSCHVPHA